MTPETAQNFLRNELKLLGATNLLISSNVMVRKDGYMYGDMASTQIEDPGVVLYFKYEGRDITMCADRYLSPIENVIALSKAIEAIRGMERWGVSEFMERAFAGFSYIEAPKAEDWWDILNVHRVSTPETIKESYRNLIKKWHPDVAGSAGEAMTRKLNQAYDKAKQERTFV